MFGNFNYFPHKCVRFINKPLLGLLHSSFGASVCPAPAALATSYSLDVKVNLD